VFAVLSGRFGDLLRALRTEAIPWIQVLSWSAASLARVGPCWLSVQLSCAANKRVAFCALFVRDAVDPCISIDETPEKRNPHSCYFSVITLPFSCTLLVEEATIVRRAAGRAVIEGRR
jgi:hypothetical protein